MPGGGEGYGIKIHKQGRADSAGGPKGRAKKKVFWHKNMVYLFS